MFPIFAFVLAGTTLFVTPVANAQTTTPPPAHNNFFQGVVDFIAQKFGLDKTQVQSAVQDYHTQQMQNGEKMRLDKLVSAGKITSDQEQAIITELAAIKTKYNPASFKGMTPDQRKTQIQNMQNDLKSWAQSQGINIAYVEPMSGMRGGFGKKMKGNGHWKGWGNTPTSTPSATPTPTP